MSADVFSGLAARGRVLLCLDMMVVGADSDHDAVTPPRFVLGCRRVLDHARASGWRIVHMHGSATGAGLRSMDGVAPLPSESILERVGVSAFSNADFRVLTRANPQAELVIIGVSVDAVCLTSALAALDRGLSVAVVTDAISVSPQERLGLTGLEQVAKTIAPSRLRMTTVEALSCPPRFAVIDGGGGRAGAAV